MFRRRWPWIVVTLLIAFSGATYWYFANALAVPTSPEQLTLYSLDGRDLKPEKRPKTTEEFHRIPVLGKLEVTDPATRREIMSALRRGIAEAAPMSEAKCFWPRHGLRITVDGEVIDYVVCFQCRQFNLVRGSSSETILTTDSPEGKWDEILQAAGVPLASKAMYDE